MAYEMDPGELLRERGLRVTPQRRAILAVFTNAPAEHLSADEVHAQAAVVVPELGRGTVYATLAELAESGLLIARGRSEPVRYETNIEPHQHFRCRVCLRLFDVELDEPATDRLADEGFVVENVATTANGVCADCGTYDRALRTAASRSRRQPGAQLPTNLAAATAETPLGTLTVAATPDGIVRVVFENHRDVPALHDAIDRRRGSRTAKRHLATAQAAIADYFAGDVPRECPIDWSSIDGEPTLRAATAVPRAHRESYDALETPADARERGRALGANPLAIIVPCHRIMRGSEIPGEYVGGPEQRRKLLQLEGT